VLIFSFADIHDAYEKFKRVFVKAVEEIGPPDLVTIAGDFGEKKNTVVKIADLLKDFSVQGVAVYGNHESEFFRRVFKEENKEILHIGPLTVLNLGATYDVHHLKILGISGNRGGGRKWTHWQDSQIEQIKNHVEKLDIILSHEMPRGYVDWCGRPRTHCGQKALRELVHELNPLLFVGGHLHETPRSTKAKNGTVIVLSGPINYKTMDFLSSFSVIEIENPSLIVFHYNYNHRRNLAMMIRKKRYRTYSNM